MLEALPLPPKGVVRAVSKSDDVGTFERTDETPKPDPADPLAVMRKVHAAGGTRINL